MSFLTRFSLKNPLAALILVVLVIAGGVYSATGLKQELRPDMDRPKLAVSSVYPGATINEVRETLALPYEKAIHNIQGVYQVDSQIENGYQLSMVQFDFDVNLDEKFKEIEDAVNAVPIPSNAQRPVLQKYNNASIPILFSSLQAKDGVSQEQLEDFVKNTIVPEIQKLDGVGSVYIDGLLASKIIVNVDADKLKAAGMTYPQLMQVIQAQNVKSPLGNVTFANLSQTVSINGTFASVGDIKEMMINPLKGLHLKDFADVQQVVERNYFNEVDGKAAVVFNIFKTQNADSVTVSNAVKDALKAHEDKVNLSIFFDGAQMIEKSVHSMTREGMLGAVFASLLIFIFLRNFRATLVAVVSIPLSLLITLIAMRQLDMTLNVMTLAGIAVATGRVVDDSIVVIENIMRRLQSEKVTKELVLDSAREVISAITSSTLTTIAVFAPLGLLGGVVGKLFGPFALSVVISLMASLLVSVTVVPMLAYLTMRKKVPAEHGQDSKITVSYRRGLGWALNHKAIVIVVSVVLLVGSLPLAALAGFTFLPQDKQKMAAVAFSMPIGTDPKDVKAQLNILDEKIRQDDRVDYTQITAGRSLNRAANFWKTMPNAGTLTVFLKAGADVDKFVQDKRQEMPTYGFKGVAEMFKYDVVSGGNFDITINVFGPDREAVKKGTEMITEAIQNVKGTENVKNNLQAATKTLTIDVRRDDALAHGLTTEQARQLLGGFTIQQPIGTMGEGNQRETIFATLKSAAGLDNIEQLQNLEFNTPAGKPVKVRDIADVKEVETQGTDRLMDGEVFGAITGGITSSNKSEVNAEIKKAINSLQLPEGVSTKSGGSQKEIDDMVRTMAMAIVIAICLVYIIMVVVFGEGKAPFAILFSIPFALIGSLLAIVISGEPISMASLIGFLMLVGIVVTNAIVYLDYAKQQMAKGISIREALLQAGAVRLRPILITALATLCALIPLVIGIGESVLISKGLAVAVLGGLITSTFMTLFIVPIMYELLYFKRARKEKTAAKPAAVTTA